MAGEKSGIDNLQALLNLYSSAKGSSTSTTTRSDISAEGTQQILNQILGSAQGLSQVAQGQKSAGIYNSSTNRLLVNDLLSRTAGEVAKLQAGTTTTNKTAGKLSGKDILGGLGLAGAKSLLGPTVSGIGKKLSTDKWGDNIAKSLGVGGDGGMSDALSSVPASTVDPADFAVLDGAGGVIDALSSFGSSLTDTAYGDALSTVGADEVVDTGSNFIADLF